MTDAGHESLQERMKREFTQALRGVSGIGDPDVSILALPGCAIVRNTLRGWSPSLHEIRMIHEMRFASVAEDARLDEKDMEDWRRSIGALAARQRSRAEDAARLGATRPFTMKKIAHLQIDKALPTLRGDTPETTRKAIVEAIRRVHATVGNHSGASTMRGGGVMLGEIRSDEGSWTRLVAPNVKLRFDNGRRMATLRDFELDLEAPHLPDTVLIALVGRPLGDLARVHPAIDNRIIRKAANREGKARPGLLLHIDLHTDPVDEVLCAAEHSEAA